MRLFFFFLLTAAVSVCDAQPGKYTVYFTDKNNSPYSLTSPSAFLSQRAIERRARQNISIDSTDLPPNPSYINQVLSSGASYLHQSRWFNAVTVFIPDNATLSAINALPFVKSAEKVTLIKKELPEEYTEKSKNSYTKKSQLQISTDVYNYGQALGQVNQLGGVCMHNQGFDGKGMVICVLDAGYNNANNLACFDSLYLNNQILGTWDFVLNESSVYEDNSHGTLVLSCMGANLPGQLIGTAPKASYWLVRTEDVGSELLIEETNWAAGAEFADSVGADIINSSLGYTTFDVSAQNHSYSDLDGNTAIATIAADMAAAKGILVCNSAGNEGAGFWRHISVPSDGDSVLAVGAVDINGVRANFSSQGPSADGRIKPDVAALGNGTYVISNSTGSVIQAGGTSFSCPLTAGMAACLWQANPTKSNMDIFYAIRVAGSQSLNPDTMLGYGIPNFCSANATLNGSSSISPKQNGDAILNLFFNPEDDSFSIYFYAHGEEALTISVYDLSGKQLLSANKSVTKNSINYYRIYDAQSLANGIYFVSIKTPGATHAQKILKY